MSHLIMKLAWLGRHKQTVQEIRILKKRLGGGVPTEPEPAKARRTPAAESKNAPQTVSELLDVGTAKPSGETLSLLYHLRPQRHLPALLLDRPEYTRPLHRLSELPNAPGLLHMVSVAIASLDEDDSAGLPLGCLRRQTPRCKYLDARHGECVRSTYVQLHRVPIRRRALGRLLVAPVQSGAKPIIFHQNQSLSAS